MNEHVKELRSICAAALSLLVPCLVVLFGIVAICILSINPQSYASSLGVKEKLLRDTPSPRIIIMGGSGAASSIDSKRLETTLDLSPVNMGVFAGLGMRLIVNEVLPEIRKGDVILLAPEYEMLQQPSYGDGSHLLQTLHANPSKTIDAVTPRGLIVMTRAFPSVLQLQAERIVHTVRNRFLPQEPSLSERLYTLKNITEHGDLDTSSAGDAHLSLEHILKDGNGFVRPHIDPKNLQLIAELFTKARDVGARAFIVLPSVPSSVSESNMANIQLQYAELAAELGEHAIIGIPGYFTFPDNHFLDSLGHLTGKGKVIRTELILNILVGRLQTL